MDSITPETNLKEINEYLNHVILNNNVLKYS